MIPVPLIRPLAKWLPCAGAGSTHSVVVVGSSCSHASFVSGTGLVAGCLVVSSTDAVLALHGV